MRKILPVLLLILLFSFEVYSQVSFSGSADITFNASIPESSDFESTMNPGNVLGYQDLGLSSALIAKLDAGDEKTTFSAWFSLKEYPIGQGFMALTYESMIDGDNATNAFLMAGEFIAVAGDTIFSLDLMRLSANVYMGDYISMEAGRQSFLTGYGYGWNPIDFANPLKNPMDPDAALRGVDGISFDFYLGDISALKVYGILPRDILSTGFEFEEIKAGGELTLFLPGLEVKLAGIYDYDKSTGSDAYTPSVGAGFMADLRGLGFYGEAALRKGSRNYSADDTGVLSRKSDWLFSALAGLEYTFPSETYAVAEYFYNGEGYDKEDRSTYEAVVQIMGAPTSDLFRIYSPGYFAQHYIMLNIMQPLYDINTDIILSAMFSPDSGALTLMPSVSYSFSANFSGKISYVGMFDLFDDDFSEVSGLPVRHMISAGFTYSF